MHTALADACLQSLRRARCCPGYIQYRFAAVDVEVSQRLTAEWRMAVLPKNIAQLPSLVRDGAVRN